MTPAAAIDAGVQGLTLAALLLPRDAEAIARDVIDLAGAAAREIAESGRWTKRDADDLRDDAREVFGSHTATSDDAPLLADAFVVLVGIVATAKRNARPLRARAKRLRGGDGEA